MSDDLKERLGGSCYLAFENGTNDYSAAQEALDRIEELEAKLAKAMGCLRFYAAVYKSPFGTRARIVLAELEGGEEAAVTAWRGRE